MPAVPIAVQGSDMSLAALTTSIRVVALWCIVACGGTRALAATLVVRAAHADGRSLAGAVITVEAQAPMLAPPAPVQAVMDQVNLAFTPDVLVVPVRSTVQFPNSDAVSHQVYSFSSARQFQLPLYRGKPYPPVSFDRPGVVTLGCNIHDNMLAYIVVTGAQFLGRSDANGAWSAGVPNGRYLVRLWHPALNEPRAVEGVVEVGGDRASIELRATRGLRPAPHRARPHSWDY